MLGECGELQPSELARRAELDRARSPRCRPRAWWSARPSPAIADWRAWPSPRKAASSTLMLPRVAAINGALLAEFGDAGVAQLEQLLSALQRQALQLLEASAWPKADRRRGGRPGTLR